MTKTKIMLVIMTIMATLSLALVSGVVVYWSFWLVGYTIAAILSDPARLAIGVLAIVLFTWVGTMIGVGCVIVCNKLWNVSSMEIES